MYAQIYFKPLRQCKAGFDVKVHKYVYVEKIKNEDSVLNIIDALPLNELFRIYKVKMNGKTYEVKTYINRINIRYFHPRFLRAVHKNPSHTVIFTLLDRV